MAMPYEAAQSPVAPSAASRLWTVGASAGVSIAVLLALAAIRPSRSPRLIGAALLVIVLTWAVNRKRPVAINDPEIGRAHV